MPAHLLSLTDGPSILIDKPILLFGRHEECDVQLNSKKVSRRHCCVAQVNDYLVVRDLGSTNGERINGACRYDLRGNFTARPSITRSRSRSVWLKNPTLRSSRESGVPRAVNTWTFTPALSGLDREVLGATGGITPEGATGISGGSTSG